MELNSISGDSEVLKCDCRDCQLNPNTNSNHLCNKDGCTQLFKSIKCLQDHLTCHQPKTFACIWQNCGKRFAFNDVLNLHLFMHMTESDKCTTFNGSKTRKMNHFQENLIDLPIGINQTRKESHSDLPICIKLTPKENLVDPPNDTRTRKVSHIEPIGNNQTRKQDHIYQPSVNNQTIKENHFYPPNGIIQTEIQNQIEPPVVGIDRLIFACNWKNCRQKFDNWQLLRNHSASHSNGKCITDPARDRTIYKILLPRQIFACNSKNCSQTFASQELLQNHSTCHWDRKCAPIPTFDRTDDKIIPPSLIFTCNWESCGQTFAIRELLETHLASHFDEISVPIGACDKTNSKILPPSANYFGCSMCNKKFFRSEHLKTHFKSHIKVKETESCSEKTDHSKGNIDISLPLSLEVSHLRKFDGFEEFICGLNNCTHSFKDISLLKLHRETDHGPNNCLNSNCINDKGESNASKWHICDFAGCSKLFPTSSQLFSHARLHTSMNVMEAQPSCFKKAYKKRKCSCSNCVNKRNIIHQSVPEKYICDFNGCGKFFWAPALLFRHALIHIEATFVCDWEKCHKSFKNAKLLQLHRQNSHEKKDFSCLECGLTFTSLSCLAIHKKVHRFKKSKNVRVPKIKQNVKTLLTDSTCSLTIKELPTGTIPKVLVNMANTK